MEMDVAVSMVYHVGAQDFQQFLCFFSSLSRVHCAVQVGRQY